MEYAYDILAEIYDEFMGDPAETQASVQQLLRELETRGIELADATVADLGCGTGRILPDLLATGRRVLAVDRSAGMLQQAMDKLEDLDIASDRVLFVQQDLRDLDLGGGLSALVCLLDTVNHMTEPDDVRRFFQACSRELGEGGVFIFDVLRAEYMQEQFGEEIYYDVGADYALLWSNDYDAASGLNRAQLTYFVETEDGLYRREDGEVAERFHPEEKLTRWLYDAGFTTVEVDPPGMAPYSHARQYYLATR